MRFAALLNAEARDLAAAGADVIQFDEPCFNIYLDKVKAWGIRALEAAIDGVISTTAIHICYSYGIPRVLAWKQRNTEWGQYAVTLPLLGETRIDQVSVECAASGVDVALLGEVRGKDVLLGVIDVGTEEIESPARVARSGKRLYVDPGRLYPCTDCGLVPAAARPPSEAPGPRRGRPPGPSRARRRDLRQWPRLGRQAPGDRGLHGAAPLSWRDARVPDRPSVPRHPTVCPFYLVDPGTLGPAAALGRGPLLLRRTPWTTLAPRGTTEEVQRTEAHAPPGAVDVGGTARRQELTPLADGSDDGGRRPWASRRSGLRRGAPPILASGRPSQGKVFGRCGSRSGSRAAAAAGGSR